MDENRLPRLWLLNIGNEAALGSKAIHYTPSRLVRQMRRDLSALPAFFAGDNPLDAVWIEDGLPSLPERSCLPARRCYTTKQLLQADFDTPFQLELWGREPSLVQQLIRHYPELFDKKIIPPTTKQLPNSFFDRTLTASFLKEWDIPTPSIINNDQELKRFANELSQDKFVIKQPFSSSGRGIHLINSKEYSKVRCKYPLIAEPYYEKVSDWAIEYTIEGNKYIRKEALSHFYTDHFRYIGNTVCSQEKLLQRLTNEVGSSIIEHVVEAHKKFLLREVAPYYQGPVGIDMMSYRKGSTLCLHPFVEINIRHTMGSVAERLFSHYGYDDKEYFLQIEHLPSQAEEGNRPCEKPYFDSTGRLISGKMWLSGRNEASRFGASFSALT